MIEVLVLACQNCEERDQISERYLKRRSRVYRRSKALSKSRSESDDILFLVETEPNNVWRVPAQRRILEENNPVFKAMFSQEIWRPEGQIPVSDVDGRGFENLIKFLHSETIDLRSVHTAVATLHASQRYLCGELTECCVDFLGKNLTTTNVLQVLQHVLLYCPFVTGCALDNLSSTGQSGCKLLPSAPPFEDLDNPHHDGSNFCSLLVKKCLEFVDDNADLILNSEDFEDLDRSAVELITKRDTLKVSDETEVFEAIKSWAVCECKRQNKETTPEKQREVLGEIFWAIRYLAMTPEQFMKGPMNSQLLTHDEQKCLTELLLHPSTQNCVLENGHIVPQLRRPRLYQDCVKVAKIGKKRARKISEKSQGKDGEAERKQKRAGDSPCVEKLFVVLAFLFE